MTFLVLNALIFIGSLFLTFAAFINYQLILNLPTPLIFLLGLGLVTPILNLYDSIKNFVLLLSPLDVEDED